jgi:hypothetical protein
VHPIIVNVGRAELEIEFGVGVFGGADNIINCHNRKIYIPWVKYSVYNINIFDYASTKMIAS